AALRGTANFERIEAEADARIRQVLAEVLLGPRQKHRSGLAVVDGREQLQWFRIDTGFGLISAEYADAIGLERGGKRGGRRVELKRFGAGEGAFGPGTELAEALGKPGLPPRRTDDDGEELLIEEQPALVELVGPAAIDLGRDRVGVAGAEVDLDAAADHVVVEDRLGIERAAQHNIAHREQVVEDIVVLGLER